MIDKHNNSDVSIENNSTNIKVEKQSNKKTRAMVAAGCVILIGIFSICISKAYSMRAKHKLAQNKPNSEAQIQKISTADARNFEIPPNASSPEISGTTISNKSDDNHTNDVNASQPVTFEQAQYTSPACAACVDEAIQGNNHQQKPFSQSQNNDENNTKNEHGTVQPNGGDNINYAQNNKQSSITTKTNFQPKKAILIRNQDFIVPQGTTIPLVLKTKIDSTLQGMVIAKLLEDIPSMTGNISLLDKETQFIGHYEKTVDEGAERLAVVWDRVTTPQGVIIYIKSLATDELGGSGINGHVNHQYGKRFGGALMLSLFQDLIATQTNKSNITNNIQNTQQQSVTIAEQMLNSSINIKPILYKNQGEIVNAILDDDLDFSNVYKLGVTNAAR